MRSSWRRTASKASSFQGGETVLLGRKMKQKIYLGTEPMKEATQKVEVQELADMQRTARRAAQKKATTMDRDTSTCFLYGTDQTPELQLRPTP